ncbi:unnamed protein product [Leptidea sinapis]|uniref:Major facilitator superfamily (MFS) profile domain-containing protein n=1 Tax=Leptidea sinapis TaxID=189913 RepID=A0A5E4R6H6_9NEOP|nr:unnamed protein product [Leptidea sinapis]
MNSVGDTHKGIVKKEDEFKVSDWGYRHQQCVLLFCCLTTAYSMRACMGVALVAMTDTSLTLSNNTLIIFENVTKHDNATEQRTSDTEKFNESKLLHSLLLIPPYPKFEWTKQIQDTIQSSFFWGYMLTQIPAGQIAHYFGAKEMLTGALLINSVVSLLLPWAAFYGGWVCTIICRILQGLSQACVMPGMHTIFGKWAPLQERGRLTAFAYGGQALGIVLGLPITGFISASPLGWPGLFRFYGILSGVVAAAMWWLGADSPAQHTAISASERRYIEEDLGQLGAHGKKKKAVPWGEILRSRGLYAIVAAHIGQTWCQLTLYTEVPAYMDKVMGVNIKANSLLTALPFLVMWFTNFFFSWFTDMLIVKKLLSVTNTRKLANCMGTIPAAIGLISLAYAPKNVYVVEIILIFICAFKISCSVGFQVNHIDISSNYSGTMMSISNFASNLVGSLAPLAAGFILTDATDANLWKQVFFLSATIVFVTNLIYVVMGTAKPAKWNDIHEEMDGPETETMLERAENETKDIEKNSY